ncbi:MAG: LamG-like jellyroll fold domain-containing protein [Planctomycetota bacterium]
MELYFTSTRANGLGSEDLWISTRQSVHDPWGPPANLQTVNSSYREAFPSISPDGLTLYFSDYFYGPDRPGGLGGHDLWASTRASRNDPWGTPVNMGAPFNSSSHDVSTTISHDALTFIFASNRPSGSGGHDLWMCARPSVQDAWGPPINLGPTVNSGSNDYYGNLSPDGLVLFFESNRGGSYGGWMTMRRTVNDLWEPPLPLPESMYSMGVGCVSADGLSFHAAVSQVPIIPAVDLNGDGTVDSADMCIMVHHWGTDDLLCDIGPMPWGDGIVDVQDLIVLAEHLFEDVNDPTLVAHWPLDEAQGGIAYDSALDCDGTLVGGPLWQPDGGAVAGALQFDGVDDYVSTDPVLNPADGAFSVVAWIMGGAPSQVILSQADGANWLCTDSVEGNLMTGLVPPAGRSPSPPLVSESTITDGNWHRIGFVWDGSNRILYVDDVEVARDTATNLEFAVGGLYIGTGNAVQSGTFFSGLIDDVRIYNRAVKP